MVPLESGDLGGSLLKKEMKPGSKVSAYSISGKIRHRENKDESTCLIVFLFAVHQRHVSLLTVTVGDARRVSARRTWTRRVCYVRTTGFTTLRQIDGCSLPLPCTSVLRTFHIVM